MVILHETGRIPVETHTGTSEFGMIEEARSFEHSGPFFALLKWGSELKQLILYTILANVFLAPWGLASTQHLNSVILAIGALLAKATAVGCVVAVIDKLLRPLRRPPARARRPAVPCHEPPLPPGSSFATCSPPDAPRGLPSPGRWLRRQAVLLAAGLMASGAALAAYTARPADSAWLAFAGVAAAATAYLVALPVRGQSANGRRRSATSLGPSPKGVNTRVATTDQAAGPRW